MRTSPDSGRRAPCWLAAPLVAAPPLLSLWYIYEYSVNAAHWDHLISAELFDRFHTGALTLEYLFRPHLEHIKVVPRIVSLALGLATRFDNRAEMYLQWLLLCATAGVLFVAIHRRLNDPNPALRVPSPDIRACASLLLFAPVVFALFTLRQHESMLVGDGMITYVSIAASVAAICLLEDARSAASAAASIVCAVVASFSHAGALVVWPIGAAILLLPWTAVSRSAIRRRTLAAWVAAAMAVLVVYAWRLPESTGSPLAGAIGRPVASLRYVVAAAGVSFAADAPAQLRFGAAAWILEAAVVLLSLASVRSTGRIPLGIWLLTFAACTRLLMAAGRVAGGHDLFIPSRYAAFMSLAIAGAWLAAVEIRGRTRRTALAAALLLVAATSLGYVEGWRAGPVERDMRLRIRQVLETVPLQTNSTLQELLYPNADHARAFAAALERLHLNVFAEERVDARTLPRSGGARVQIDAINGSPVPPTTPIAAGRDTTIHLAGWAFERTAAAPFDRAFVLVDGTTAIPAAYGLDRPDVAREIGGGLSRTTGVEARFSTAWLAPGAHTIALQFITRDRRAITTEPVATIVVR